MNGYALAGAFALVLLNGFFVALEFALVSVRPTQLKQLIENNVPGAVAALEMRGSLDRWLSACQIGVTLASLALGYVGEPAIEGVVEILLSPLGAVITDMEHVVKPVGVVLSLTTLTFLHVVIGEQVPKLIALREAERTLLSLQLPGRGFALLFAPFVTFLNWGTTIVCRMLGFEAPTNAHEVLKEDELRLMLATAAESGVMLKARAELLDRALSMMEKTARQVMVPRSQMKAIDLDQSLDENLQAAQSAGHTWLPVVRGSLDRVEGLVNVKDLLFLKTRGELKSVTQVQRPVLFVPEQVTLEQLLSEFKRKKKQLAVVVDEHGGTSGLVSIADVVAELLGDVTELGRKVEPMTRLPGGRLELPGTAQLDDLEHTLETSFDLGNEEVTTIAGFLMAKLKRVPLVNDTVVHEDFQIVVVATDGPRVTRVRFEPLKLPPPSPSSPTPGDPPRN